MEISIFKAKISTASTMEIDELCLKWLKDYAKEDGSEVAVKLLECVETLLNI